MTSEEDRTKEEADDGDTKEDEKALTATVRNGQKKDWMPTKRTSKETETIPDLIGKVKVKKGSREEEAFYKSRAEELDGLLKYGTFVPVDIKYIEGNPRIFGSRFIDEIKRAGHTYAERFV